MFKVGEVVRCIDDEVLDQGDVSNFDRWLVKNDYYTIRSLVHMPDGNDGVCLNEITGSRAVCRETQEVMEFCFDPRRFIRVGGPQE